jgi:hypothetical protein
MKAKLWLLVIGFAALLGACAPGVQAQAEKTQDTPVVNSYIVTLKPHVTDVSAEARRLSDAVGAQLGHVYASSLKGFSAQMSAQAAERMRLDGAVQAIEADAPVRLAPPVR